MPILAMDLIGRYRYKDIENFEAITILVDIDVYEENFKAVTIYKHGGHLRQALWTVYKNFLSPLCLKVAYENLPKTDSVVSAVKSF